MSDTIVPPTSSELLPTSASPDDVPDLPSWRQEMRERHSEISPQQQRALAERRATRQRLENLTRRGEQAERMSTISRAAFLGSCISYEASSAPERAMVVPGTGNASSTALTTVFGEAAMPQTTEQSRQRTVAATDAIETLQLASQARCIEEGDEVIDRALTQLSAAGYSFAHADGGAGAEAAAEIANESLDELLASLKREPTTDEDREARFTLYERHAETVSMVRKSLLEFWESAREEVKDASPRAAIDEQVAKIDDHTNLEMFEDRRYWFVYSMAKATARNESSIQNVLKAIRAKLVLLAEQEQTCPICLEPIICSDEGDVALGCAHKLHSDCWRHWSAHCVSVRKTPFCPTCRNEDFLDEIL